MSLISDDARVKFKEYVNQLATTKTENNDKFVTIRKRYLTSNAPISPSLPQSPTSPISPRQPPPYRQPPEVRSPTSFTEPDDDTISQCSEYSLRSNIAFLEPGEPPGPPQVPPRRKSQEKLKAYQNELESPSKDEDGVKLMVRRGRFYL